MTLGVLTRRCDLCGAEVLHQVRVDLFERWQSGEPAESLWPRMDAVAVESLRHGRHHHCIEGHQAVQP